MVSGQKWLERRYLFYSAFTNLWFVGAVWLYFYRLFITDQQVGFLDGMAFFVGLLAEIPAGAIADKFGRDRTVRTGQILAGSGLLIQATGSSFMPFFVGQSILMIGASLVSGADDALFYQQLGYDDSLKWRKLLTRAAQITLLGSVVAYTAGGYLHGINPRLPWALTGVSFLVAALLIWPVKDTRPKTDRRKFADEVKDYLGNIKAGVLKFRMPELRLYVPLIITVQGLFYAAGWGILRLILLSRFGFSPLLGAVLISACSLATVGILHLMHKNANRLSEKWVLSAIALAAAACLLFAIPGVGYWGALVIFVLYAGEHSLFPFMSEILNKHAPEEQRATVLSVASFFRTLPYVGLAPLLGYLNTNHHLNYFLVTWPALILVSLIAYLSIQKQDSRIAFSDKQKNLS